MVVEELSIVPEKTTDYHDLPVYTSHYQEDQDFSNYKTDIKNISFLSSSVSRLLKKMMLGGGRDLQNGQIQKRQNLDLKGTISQELRIKDFGYYTLDNH